MVRKSIAAAYTVKMSTTTQGVMLHSSAFPTVVGHVTNVPRLYTEEVDALVANTAAERASDRAHPFLVLVEVRP